MPGFGFQSGIKIKFRAKALGEKTEQLIQAQVREAARVWLRTLVEHIPVWTGMARGALKFAKGRSSEASGRFLGEYLNVAIPIDPVDTSRPDKNPEAGGRQSRYTFSNTAERYVFTYNTEVRHLILNDLYYGSPNGPNGTGLPWGGFETAAQAFQDYLKETGRKRIESRIKLKDFIEFSDVSLADSLRRDSGGT